MTYVSDLRGTWSAAVMGGIRGLLVPFSQGMAHVVSETLKGM